MQLCRASYGPYGTIVYARTANERLVLLTTKTALAISYDVTHGKCHLHYYYEGYTLLLMYSLYDRNSLQISDTFEKVRANAIFNHKGKYKKGMHDQTYVQRGRSTQLKAFGGTRGVC